MGVERDVGIQVETGAEEIEVNAPEAEELDATRYVLGVEVDAVELLVVVDDEEDGESGTSM